MGIFLSDLPRHIGSWAALRRDTAGPLWPSEILRRTGVVAGCLVAAVLVRALLGEVGASEAPYATLFPAIGVAALFAGFWAGVATMALGWLAAWYFFVGPAGFTPLSTAEATGALIFVFSAGILLLTAVWLRDTLMRLEQGTARFRALIEASTNVVVNANGDGTWNERQPMWEALTGTAWPAYRGDGWLSALHEEDRAAVRAALRSAHSELGDAQGRIWSQPDNEWRWFAIRTVAIFGPRGFDDRVITFADIHERKLARERQELMIGDLRHRLKNLIAVIHALLTSSLPRQDPASAAVAEKFMARLRAIQNAGDLIMAANWHDVDVGAIVRSVLAPFIDAHKSKFAIEGPPLLLHEHTAGGIALACHELATNAVKYGALAAEHGSITITWAIEPLGDDEAVSWQWLEHDGPSVSPPADEGFGLRVIRSALVRERENTVDLAFDPDGLKCRMRFQRSREPTGTEPAKA